MRSRLLCTLLFTLALPFAMLACVEDQTPTPTVEGGSASEVIWPHSQNLGDDSAAEMEAFTHRIGMTAVVILFIIGSCFLAYRKLFPERWE